MLEYLVDYQDGDKTVVSLPLPFLAACALARKPSREFDSAYVVAFDGSKAVGHVPYFNGRRDTNAIEGRTR